MALADVANGFKRFMLGPEADYVPDEEYVEYEDEMVDMPRREREIDYSYGKKSADKHGYDKAGFDKGSYDNVVSMPGQSQRERVVITHPQTLDEAPSIADHLRMNMTCVVNLEGIEHAQAQRIADFLGGAAYSLSCEIERVSNDIFVIAPPHVGVSNDKKVDKKSGILPWAR